MQQIDGSLILSATDLINHLECDHLTWLDLERALGRLDAEPERPDTAVLLSQKGDEHERRHLEALTREFGAAIAEITTGGKTKQELLEAAESTEAAMRAGAPVIYQATFLQDGWRGHADFLERVPGETHLGDWGYEVHDTKLARQVKPYHIVQLCLYSEFVGQIQGVAPKEIHVILGTGEGKSFPLADFAAYYRRMRAAFRARIENGLSESYADKVAHCGLCAWTGLCDRRREADDHLSRIARITRSQIEKLNVAGVRTVAELAARNGDAPLGGIGRETFERLAQQARLQVDQRKTGKPSYELLEPELDPDKPRRGFALLPKPSNGDVFFDIEGDPFYEDGLEYLWGVTYVDDGDECFRAFWGRDRAEEKRAFEDFIDFVIERRRRYPDMHVYHYASYEPTALKRLMGLHATREDEVDGLLRGNVLVDLYRVVEQSMRISQPSYSLKKIEAFYMDQRDASVTDGEDSILKFEEWLGTDDDALLDWIRTYNQEDCHSTLLLRNWLLEGRDEATAKFGFEIPYRPLGETEVPADAAERDARIAELEDALWDSLPEDPAQLDQGQWVLWLLGHLLSYHRREDKPAWLELFDRFELSEEELTHADTEALGGLEPIGDPVQIGGRSRSATQRMSFPSQEHKLSEGEFLDPATVERDAETEAPNPFSPNEWEILELDDDRGELTLKVTPSLKNAELPRALIPGRPIPTPAQREALQDLAGHVIDEGLDGARACKAARAILTRQLPRSSAVAAGGNLQDGPHDLARTIEIARGLDGSYLFVQGPPGSGKTYTGAQLVLDLLAAGKRVGIAAPSHKAIHNLLHEIELWADRRGQRVEGLHKSSSNDPESRFRPEIGNSVIESIDSPRAVVANDARLRSGTAWLWSREDMRKSDGDLGPSVDYLVIDEAGQIALADALAMGMAATNVILLGDPLQLAQVSQGAHPERSGVSVLEHLLGDDATVPADRGVFLDKTRRMHPDITGFVSEAIYAGRLSSEDFTANQRIDARGAITGTGVRALMMDHQGNTRVSPEEAKVVAERVAVLVGADYTKADRTIRKLRGSDVMVVAPYNAQVRCLREHLDAAGLADVQVGTVDKFQGQQAAVVFFSMATSSGENVPRNVEFLYSRNRLNVAASRAKCLAVLVCSPDLLTIRCRTVEQMRLVNALCLLVEMSSTA